MKIIEEEPPLVDECKLPPIIDAFLYPISSSGLVHLAVFLLAPILVSFFVRLLSIFLGPYLREGTGYIMRYLTVPFYIVFYSYVLYYIALCIFNSTKGRRRAPDIPISGTLDIGDLASQAILLLGCVAICYWPAAIYYLIKNQTDSWFWLLSACGTFFLPMTFLRGVMFDSFDALNPVSIIWSIIKTFLPYCWLVLFFFTVGGLIAAVLPKLPIWSALIQAVKIYLIFILAHRVGWFYWQHEDKLDWGI